MELTAQEAQQALDDVAIAERRTNLYRSLKGYDSMSYLWGGIWTVGFGLQQFLAGKGIMLHIGRVSMPAEGFFWTPLCILGLVGGGLILSRGEAVRSERERELGKAIGFMWLAVYLFVGFWMFLTAAGAGGPLFVGAAGERILTAIYATIPMFALLLMGLFGVSQGLIFESIFITVMTGVGLLVAGEWFYLYMAIVGGGTQLIIGVIVQMKLRRESWKTTTE